MNSSCAEGYSSFHRLKFLSFSVIFPLKYDQNGDGAEPQARFSAQLDFFAVFDCFWSIFSAFQVPPGGQERIQVAA